ncbi:sigma-54 dependent transcriptional regulator [Brucella pseudogrignonensis]|uniref:DNA-binding transcriptional regulator NtrC n=1 Tax=Brucella pseudogrignonensis TaxID=419475 RepID=A0ABU1MCI8_9HYPH|nr:sigma-54 dependent transcriptional regulator [Brucella pseudogrignonensis]MDR6433762.1 DNA-binding NtrC family response regulator [Brucella pseudogrignonensis]
MSTRILIVDDDPIQCRGLEAAVLRMGYRTILADGGINALNIIGSRKDVSLILLDLSLPDLDGYAVLTKLRESGISIPVIALVLDTEIENAMHAIRLGAIDFIVKPAPFERVQVSIANVFKLDSLTHEIKRTRVSQKSDISLSEMSSKSSEMEKVVSLARRAASLDTPVLIEGEVGTGKETLARAIVSGGNRWQGAFVAVDCRSLIRESADEILFGQSADHDFLKSDSVPDKVAGKVAEAEGGSLFFDQISALPPRTQQRLFAFIKASQSISVGEKGSLFSDVRLIASDSHSLAELVQLGQFHPGLYHFFASFSITMPHLRDRSVDIPVLAHQFLMRFASEERRGHIAGITPYALECLKSYDWPGNVRELKNAIYQAVILSNETALTARDFRHIGFDAIMPASKSSPENRISPLAAVVSHNNGAAISSIDFEGQVRTLAAAEEQMIRIAIAHYDGQISEVARRLGIGRTTLYRKLKEYGVDVATISHKAQDDALDVDTHITRRTSRG